MPILAFTNVTKEEEGFWLCRARNTNGESVSCLHLIVAECDLSKKKRKCIFELFNIDKT